MDPHLHPGWKAKTAAAGATTREGNLVSNPRVRPRGFVLLCIQMFPRSIEFWGKVAQIVQGFATPLIAVFIGIVTYRIQRQQAKTQQQQAKTGHLQHRLALMDRRMKVFNATLDFIVFVMQEAKVEKLDRCFQLLRDTKGHDLLFGPEIGEYINELYKKGTRLHAISQMSGPQKITRPEDIPVDIEMNEWFSQQIRVAEEKFLKYLDFREP